MTCGRGLSAVPVLSVRGNIMAEKLDPKDLVTLDELALSNMWETSALVERWSAKASSPSRKCWT